MSYGLACHECDHRNGATNHEGDVLPGYSYHDSRGEALEARWQHIEDTGHGDIYVIGGCYFIGDGPRPRRLPGSDGDRFEPFTLDSAPSRPAIAPDYPSKWKVTAKNTSSQ